MGIVAPDQSVSFRDSVGRPAPLEEIGLPDVLQVEIPFGDGDFHRMRNVGADDDAVLRRVPAQYRKRVVVPGLDNPEFFIVQTGLKS